MALFRPFRLRSVQRLGPGDVDQRAVDQPFGRAFGAGDADDDDRSVDQRQLRMLNVVLRAVAEVESKRLKRPGTQQPKNVFGTQGVRKPQ